MPLVKAYARQNHLVSRTTKSNRTLLPRYLVEKGYKRSFRALSEYQIKVLVADGWTVTPETQLQPQEVADHEERLVRSQMARGGESRTPGTSVKPLGKKWAGDLKAAPARLYTHITIRTLDKAGRVVKHTIPLENFDRGGL
jgi:hypothetical protein